MRYIVSFVLLLIPFMHNAQGISFFHGEWKEALAEAKSEDKILFVDAYAQWCGPCKRMARDVFTQEKVGDFFNKNFVNLKLDMEQKDGATFGQKYPVSAYPTLFFLDVDGNIIKKITGGQQAEQLIALGKDAIKSFDRSDQYAEKYEAGDRDIDLMINYVKELNKVGKPSQKIANEFIASDPDISNQNEARFLMAAVVTADSKLFDQLIALKSDAIDATSLEKFEDTVEKAALNTVDRAIEYEIESLVDEANVQYKKANLGNDQAFEYVSKMRYHAGAGNYSDWENLSKKAIKKFGKKDTELMQFHLTELLNNFQHVEDASIYKRELAQSIVKYDDTIENNLMYIKMLIRDKQNEDALEWTQKAMKKYKSDEAQLKRLEQILDFLNQKGIG